MNWEIAESDLERIRAKIAWAEQNSPVEIVQFVIDQSDDYEVVVWRGAAFLSLVFLLATLLIYQFYSGWSLGWLYTGVGLATGLLSSALLGVILVRFVEPFFRAVAGSELLRRRTRARAERVFIEEGVFSTQRRTGILLFISLRERRIEVLADKGLAAAVPDSAWARVVTAASAQLGRGDLTEALIAAVETCATIVRESGLDAGAENANELDDELRIGRWKDE